YILFLSLVNFDLDIGPVIYGVYPTFDLSPSERENISFSSFPDSSHFEEYSQVHSFRIRESNPKRTNKTSECFLHSFAYFSRRRSSAAKRGYEQQSVVLVSQHPWPSIFTELVSCLGPMYLSHGAPMLEAACHNIASWSQRSEPCPGSTLELGFLGTVLNVELPDAANDQQLTEISLFQEKNGQDRHILASTAPSSPPPLRLFAASLSHMWSIWECLILNEPLLIYGTSPAMTSQAVWWLLDVLRPLPFGGDFRPYFTIHDNDYLSLVNKNPPQAGLLLGVTNPFITSTCKHWPHVLSLGREVSKQTHGRGSSSTPIAGPPPGWQTKTHKRHISKDRELLKQLESNIDSGEAAEREASQLLLRHFSSRTSAFLVPLNRYLTTLIPTPSEIPARTGPVSAKPSISLKPFNQSQFFASLKTHGSPLPFKSIAKRKDFYERWLRSPSFGLWIAKQDEIVSDVLSKNALRATNASSER
ncbi:DUF1630-domain-containing protein, partial [Rickenella mellea]